VQHGSTESGQQREPLNGLAIRAWWGFVADTKRHKCLNSANKSKNDNKKMRE
jgi:hypothetical protein